MLLAGRSGDLYGTHTDHDQPARCSSTVALAALALLFGPVTLAGRKMMTAAIRRRGGQSSRRFHCDQIAYDQIAGGGRGQTPPCPPTRGVAMTVGGFHDAFARPSGFAQLEIGGCLTVPAPLTRFIVCLVCHCGGTAGPACSRLTAGRHASTSAGAPLLPKSRQSIGTHRMKLS